jgi:heat shock protein HslJ
MKTLFGVIIPIFFVAASSFSSKENISVVPKIQIQNSPLTGTRWQLVELSGTKNPANATTKKMWLSFKADSTVSGNGGCNAFSGNYSLGKDNQISFGEMVRTNVLCPGIDYEKNLYECTGKSRSLRFERRYTYFKE